MTKFIEISKINSYGEEGVALIKLDDIQGITQKHVEKEKLYNEQGDLVSEKEGDKKFGVLVATERGNNEVFYVNENEYQRLKGILTQSPQDNA